MPRPFIDAEIKKRTMTFTLRPNEIDMLDNMAGRGKRSEMIGLLIQDAYKKYAKRAKVIEKMPGQIEL